LATTGPAGGLLAIARGTGVVLTMGGAGLVGGTIFLGSGRAGAATGGAAAAAGAEGFAGVLAVAAGVGGVAVTGLRASTSCSCFRARMAFITSPGLETWERSIFGAIPCEPREAPPAWPALRKPWLNCARTFSASCSSNELEWVLPPAMPSSANTSRIWRLLTSNSRARSLIRTLLIRLFSEIATQSPLVAHSYLMAMVALKLHYRLNRLQRCADLATHLIRPLHCLQLTEHLRLRAPLL
jgi:hypothetical protein